MKEVLYIPEQSKEKPFVIGEYNHQLQDQAAAFHTVISDMKKTDRNRRKLVFTEKSTPNVGRNYERSALYPRAKQRETFCHRRIQPSTSRSSCCISHSHQ